MLRAKFYYRCSNRAEFTCIAGVNAVAIGLSSTSISSFDELRLVPRLSEEALPTTEGSLVYFVFLQRHLLWAFLAEGGGTEAR